MLNLATLARPYARAAFDLAREQGRLADWDGMLELAATISAQPELERLFDHPDVAPGKLARAMADLGGERFDDSFNRFLGVLADAGRLQLLPEVHERFGILRREHERAVKVRVVSAYPLDDDQRQRLQQALERRLERDVTLVSEVDEGLIGGALIYADGDVIDGSLRGRLQRMATALAP